MTSDKVQVLIGIKEFYLRKVSNILHNNVQKSVGSQNSALKGGNLMHHNQWKG